jgi:ABC-2 type transport system ATP-binding protein
MEIRLLGPVSATRQGLPVDLGPRRQRFVLAVLALEVNQAVPVERLVELAWTGDAPRTAVNAIQVCVSRLRTALHELSLDRDGDAYRLRADPQIVDVHRFVTLVDEAGRTPGKDDRSRLLTTALALWKGPPLVGTTSPEVRERLFRAVDSVRLTAVESLLDTLIPLRRPGSERLVAQHVLALARDAQTGAALALLHRARRRLSDDPLLHRLADALRLGEPCDAG